MAVLGRSASTEADCIAADSRFPSRPTAVALPQRRQPATAWLPLQAAGDDGGVFRAALRLGCDPLAVSGKAADAVARQRLELTHFLLEARADPMVSASVAGPPVPTLCQP